MKVYLFLSIALLSLVPMASTSADSLSVLQRKAQDSHLGLHPQWLNLLHYKAKHLSPSGYVSYVDDDKFFYSTRGDSSPESELDETLAAFYRTDTVDDSHALCRFPARFSWLKNQLGIDMKSLPNVVCQEYDDWRRMIRAKQATLVFPAYYLNSPSSMFGHTLLRLDVADEDEGSEWLSFAISFGADVREGDNTLEYAYRGLSGGYQGLFSVMPYYNKIQEYNTLENRDIWEYHLNLSEIEVDRMVAHLWELKEIEFDYYFFDENCSFRLLELLEVARPGIELTDYFGVNAIPVDTVRAIVAEGLTDEVEYRPSQAVVLKDRLSKISQKNKKLVKRISLNPDVAEEDEFKSLPEAQKKKIITAAYKYLRFKQTKKARDKKVAHDSYQLLTLINKYPEDKAEKLAAPVRPDKGHHSRRLSVGGGERDEKAYAAVGLRMAFHSLEDRAEGFLEGAQINMFNMQASVDEEGDLHLKQFDIIDIISLTPRDDFFKPLSWKVYTGLEEQFVGGRDHTVSHVTAGAGVTYSIVDSGTVYALGTGRIEYNRVFENNGFSAALGASFGGVYYSDLGVSKLDLSGFKFENSEERLKLGLSQTITLAQNHALQFSFQREWYKETDFNEFGLRYHYYYD